MCVFEYEEIPLVILKCELLGPAKVNECQTFKYKFSIMIKCRLVKKLKYPKIFVMLYNK